MTAPGVLLVDDNEDCRIIYGSTLRHAGYTVWTAVDGVEGLAHAVEKKPGLILLDIGMPRMNGLEALEQLKLNPQTAEIPVIAVSARIGKEQFQELGIAGFSEVLLKPVTPAAILETVQRHLPMASN
jgi:two-component system chemotaxis response regulator CheY